MKRTISTLAILGTLAVALPSAKAGETGRPSRADMFNGLLVVGVYSRLCPTPLSEYAKAQTRTVLRMLNNVDSALLEHSIAAYSDRLISQDIGPWCSETAKALSATKSGVDAPAGPQS
jgi:hypothetical protein